jgi:hypothetical protein
MAVATTEVPRVSLDEAIQQDFSRTPSARGSAARNPIFPHSFHNSANDDASRAVGTDTPRFRAGDGKRRFQYVIHCSIENRSSSGLQKQWI